MVNTHVQYVITEHKSTKAATGKTVTDNDQIIEDQRNQWRAMAELRRDFSEHQREVAVLQQQMASQNEKHDRMLMLMEKVDKRTIEMQDEYHKMRGGMALAKWLAGVMASCSGAAVAVYVWWHTR